mmetsp:Transcript_2092/g.6558  ORF Transcript_2092/g.6558 Transcript_2092/m.6558 type:complete len:239 (-) Transcript_2092:854-1570(-)
MTSNARRRWPPHVQTWLTPSHARSGSWNFTPTSSRHATWGSKLSSLIYTRSCGRPSSCSSARLRRPPSARCTWLTPRPVAKAYAYSLHSQASRCAACARPIGSTSFPSVTIACGRIMLAAAGQPGRPYRRSRLRRSCLLQFSRRSRRLSTRAMTPPLSRGLECMPPSIQASTPASHPFSRLLILPCASGSTLLSRPSYNGCEHRSRRRSPRQLPRRLLLQLPQLPPPPRRPLQLPPRG